MKIPRTTWLSIAGAACVFSFIVLAVMLGTFAKPLREDPLDTNEWRTLKTQLAGRPGDRAEADRIRTLDLELRRAYFRNRERIRTGGTLLLVGLVTALVALGRANRRTRPVPAAPAAPMPEAERDRRSARAGIAVTATGVVFLAGAVWLSFFVPGGIPRPADGPAPEVPGGTDRGPPSVLDFAAQWASFRGYEGSGIAPPGEYPLAWDGTSGENVAWKTLIPLPGANSPIVWGDRVFLTGSDGRREEVYCIDANTGAMLWQKALVVAGRREETPEPMEDTGYAAPTAATDGRRVYAMFASGRVAAFDLEGTQVWLRSFGPFENIYGHSSSLAVFEDRLLLQLDHGYADKPLARLVALDTATGKTVWETPRAVDSSWASPIVAYPASGPQVVLSATPFAAAYDPATGAGIWRAEVLYGEVAPTPICRDGVAYLTQEGVGLYAVGMDGTGDVTETHLRWHSEEAAPDVTSPICDGSRVYLLNTGGTFTCIRVADGGTVYQVELGSDFYASPSLAGDVLYLTDVKGVTRTVRTGDEFQEIGSNPLGMGVYSSMAFAPGRIYLRSGSHLFAIGGSR